MTITIIGIYDQHNGEVLQLFEKDDQEKLLNDFINEIDHQDGTLISYSASNFDKRAIQNALMKSRLDEEGHILEPEIDLGIEVMNGLLGDFDRIALKEISHYFGFERNVEGVDGFEVGLAYSRYLDNGDEPDWDTFLEYNKEDLFATAHIFNHLKEVGQNPSNIINFQ